ncbi:MAG TPA: hypothetical protein VJJ47_02620 [Candidatus Paceibacterota bacterium]
MITCPNPDCKSTRVKVVDLNFASLKREGEPADRSPLKPPTFYCHDCRREWASSPEADSLYAEYVTLRDENRPAGQVGGTGGSYEVPQVIATRAHRRNEIAQKLRDNHPQHLDLSPDEWLQISEDAACVV